MSQEDKVSTNLKLVGALVLCVALLVVIVAVLAALGDREYIGMMAGTAAVFGVVYGLAGSVFKLVSYRNQKVGSPRDAVEAVSLAGIMLASTAVVLGLLAS